MSNLLLLPTSPICWHPSQGDPASVLRVLRTKEWGKQWALPMLPCSPASFRPCKTRGNLTRSCSSFNRRRTKHLGGDNSRSSSFKIITEITWLGKLQIRAGAVQEEGTTDGAAPVESEIKYATSFWLAAASTEIAAISHMTFQHHKSILSRIFNYVFMVSLFQAFFNPEIEIILV